MRKSRIALMRATQLALVLMCMCFATLAFGQTSGKIAGTVTDKGSGDALPGVNVQIEGTNLGASTDSEGRYFILNVPPGLYSVKASFIGYKAQRTNDVKVSVGQTATTNFSLETTIIEGEEVVVTATRPLIEPDQTVSVSTYSSTELNNSLPVAKVTDILETSPSVYRGYIRGGARYETKFIVDGVDVNDSYFSSGQGAYGGESGDTYFSNRPTDNNDNTGLTQDGQTLAEVQVFAGVFNAEYPSATAGVVNIVTKEGGRDFNFSFYNRTLMNSGKSHAGRSVYWDAPAYLAERDEKLNSGNEALVERGNLFTWTPDRARELYNYDPADSSSLSRSHENSFTLSGPLGSKGGFFLAGNYSQNDGALPFERTKRIGASLKLHYNLSPTQKLVARTDFKDGGELFNFVNTKYNPRFKYYLEGAPRYKDLSSVGFIKYTNALNSKTFIEIQASNTSFRNRVGFPDDNGNGIPELGESGDFIEFADIDEYIKYVGGNGNFGTETGFVFGDTTRTQRVFFSSTLNPAGFQRLNQAEYDVLGYGTNGFYITSYPIALYQDFKRSKTTFKADVTSQVNYSNLVKAGISFSVHDIDVNSLESELGGSGTAYPTSHFHVNQYNFKPKEIAIYAQDKIEFVQGLIVNVGARIDGFDNDTQRFINDFDPLDEVLEGGELVSRTPKRGDDVGFNFFFSPRVGVAHPVTDRLKMSYSFGRFFQYPNFETIYRDYNFTDYAASPTTRTVNPDQDPIRSTNYEIRTEWSFADNFLITGTAYYRDVSNTSSRAMTLTTAEGVGLTFNTTWGYSDSRGIEVELTKRPSDWFLGSWGGRLAYAHSYIKQAVASGSDPTIRTNFNSAVDSVNYAELPFDDLDRFPSRERNVLVTQGGTNILAGGYDRPHRLTGTLQLFFPADFTATFIGEWSSGFYYIETENPNNDPFFSRNDNLGIGPSTSFINARLSKFLDFGATGLELFLEARNLFNFTNIRGISNGGLPGAPIELEREIWEQGRPDGDGGRLTEPESDPEGIFAQPTDLFGRLFYENLREIYFGIKFNFK